MSPDHQLYLSRVDRLVDDDARLRSNAQRRDTFATFRTRREKLAVVVHECDDHSDWVTVTGRPVEDALAAALQHLVQCVVIETHRGEVFVIDFFDFVGDHVVFHLSHLSLDCFA